jgi:phenylpropionate dioxygenase-like ring-hydroxylating dioxygenase large terminal subunit
MTESALALRLRDYWYIAAESRALRASPIHRTILGEHVVLFRDERGNPAALRDRCAHRNMRLSAGKVRDGRIECPYHGWTYSRDGACVGIPSLDVRSQVAGGRSQEGNDDQSCDPRPATRDLIMPRIDAFPAIERDGFVWIWMGSAEPSREPFRFEHAGERGWTTFRMTTRFEASAFACLENFLDVPHTVYVHGGWFRSRSPRLTRARVRTEADGAVAEFDEEPERQSVVARLLFPKRGKLTHTDRFVMPSTSRVDYSFGPNRHFIITSQCTPAGELETDVYTVITFRFGAISPLVRLYFEPLSRRILRQDIDILREQSAQIRRFGGSRYTFTEADLLGPRILRLWNDAVSGRPTPASESEVNLRF